MKLVCPGCGATASAEAWVNDATCREVLQVVSRLQAPLPKTCLGYLSLFRPGVRALTWKKALRVSLEVEQLTGRGFVNIQGKVDRNCPARIWAKAMEQMLEQRDRLNLPMPNHNYLRKVAYDLADQMDYRQEKKSESQKQAQRIRPDRSKGDINLDPLEKARREWDAEHEVPTEKKGLNDLSTCIKGME